MTPSDLYSIVKDVEHVWGSVVFLQHNERNRRVFHVRDESDPAMEYEVPASAAAALIRDCLARWGHERGWDVRLTGNEPEEGPAFAYGRAWAPPSGYADTYLAALVAMVKEGE